MIRERCLLYLIYSCPASVKVRLLQWLGCLVLLVFGLNPNFCLQVSIILVTVFYWGNREVNFSPLKMIWVSRWNALMMKGDIVKVPVIAILSPKVLLYRDSRKDEYVCIWLIKMGHVLVWKIFEIFICSEVTELPQSLISQEQLNCINTV